MIFRKAHYIIIADAIKRVIEQGTEHQAQRLLHELIEDFGKDNPNFNATKFIKACQPDK